MKMQKLTQKLGLSWPIIIGLAALALPRAIGHDLKIIDEGDLITKFLVYIPLAVWVIVALWKKVPKPFLTLCAVGLTFGVMLAITHQLAWASFWSDGVPQLGGNLDNELSPATEEIILRIATFISSIITGLIMGAAAGAIAFGAKYVMPTDKVNK